MKGVLRSLNMELDLQCLFGLHATTNIFFLAIHFFNFFVPIAKPARQAAVLGRLSLSMCHWVYIPLKNIGKV